MISAVIKYEDRRVSIHDSATKEVGKTFSKGFYEATTDSQGNLRISEADLQELHTPYESEEINMIVSVVNGFFREGTMEKINQLGFIHKLGILLFGKQGTGKTSFIHYMANKLIDSNNAIVFFCNSSNTLSSAIILSAGIREIQDNPIIFIADEFERYAKDAESEMKNFLDGNKSVNNTLFLAATNYIEKVPETLKKRPSRFKIVREIKGITDKNTIANIIREVSNRIDPSLFTKEEIYDIVKDIDEITLDEIKHICLDKATSTYTKSLIKDRGSVGFKLGSTEDETSLMDREGFIFSWGGKPKDISPTKPNSNI